MADMSEIYLQFSLLPLKTRGCRTDTTRPFFISYSLPEYPASALLCTQHFLSSNTAATISPGNFLHKITGVVRRKSKNGGFMANLTQFLYSIVTRTALIGLLPVMMLTTSCGLIESDDEEEPQAELFNGTAFSVTGNTLIPSVAVHSSGHSMSIISETNGVQPTGAIFSDTNGRSLVVYADQNGFPKRVTSNNTIYNFDSYELNKVDVGVINPAGDISILRSVEFDNSPYQNLSTTITEAGSVSAWKFAAVSLNTAAAVTSLAGSDSFANTIRSSSMMGTCLGMTESDQQKITASASGLPEVAGAFGCSGDVSACSGTMASLNTTLFNTSKSEIESKSDAISVTEGALDTGFGDVQVTLTWDTATDQDLWVTDPEGEVIYYGNPASETGGELDRDDVDGFGPENVFWESGTAPAGEYKVEVDYFSGSGVTNYTVLVQAFGRVRTFTGQISPDETKLITTFSESGISKEMPVRVQKSDIHRKIKTYK